MPQEVESAKNIIGQNVESESIRSRLGLPTGFVTEKGSAYSYLPDGRIHRDKFDGTQHDQGIAVFVPDTAIGKEVISSMGAISTHLPAEERFKLYITEASKDTQTGQIATRRIYSSAEVTNPDSLYLTSETSNGLNRRYAVKVDIKPAEGFTVFEMDKLPNGDTNRHPGHKVVAVIA